MSYTLAYVNKNMDLHFIENVTLDVCIPMPEDLIFVACRRGNETIFDPDNSIGFSNLERLIIGLRGSFDLSFVKDSHFRKQNSTMCPILPPVPTNLSIAYVGLTTIGLTYNIAPSNHNISIQISTNGVDGWTNLETISSTTPSFKVYRDSVNMYYRLFDSTYGIYSNVLLLEPAQ